MNQQIKTLLKQHRINVTEPRITILESFINSKDGLDYNYFLNTAIFTINRTTVFRTLNLFAKKKLIYKIPAIDGVSRYLLQHGSGESSETDHCSFICSSCRKVVPLTSIKHPTIKLPVGYKLHNIEILLTGTCKTCKHQHNSA